LINSWLFPVRVFDAEGVLQYEISAQKVLERQDQILYKTIPMENCYIRNKTSKNHIFYCSDCGIKLGGIAKMRSSKLCKKCMT